MASVGCRPITPEEIEKIKEHFEHRKDKLAVRDITLIFFGFYTGFRISEILSIKVRDLYQYGKIADEVYIKRCHMKGKIAGRNVPLNENCKKLLLQYLQHYEMDEKVKLDRELYLFPSNRVGFPLTSRACDMIVKKVFRAEEMTGKLACHSLRKTFSMRMYDALDHDILKLQKAMGHKQLSSTQHYISCNDQQVINVVKNLAF